MKVAEYRNLIDAVGQSLASLKGCTRSERVSEARWVRSTLNELCDAEKPARLKDDDRARVASMIKHANETLANAGC